MESIKLKQYKNRLLVSGLIFDVLTDKKSVQEALLHFPKDKDDINIKCAFDALIYRDADEDLRKKDANYKVLQDELLETIATILKNNHQLPQNIILRYLKYHNDDIISNTKTSFFKDVIRSLKRTVNL